MRYIPALSPFHLLVTAFVFSFLSADSFADKLLLRVDADLDVASIPSRDVDLSVVSRGNRQFLRMAAGHQQKWPGITLKPSDGRWDLSPFEYVAMEVKNAGEHQARVGLRIDSTDAAGERATLQTVSELAPGEQRTVQLGLQRRMPPKVSEKLFGMRGYPGSLSKEKGLNAQRIDQVSIFVNRPEKDHVIEIANLRADGSFDGSIWLTEDANKLFPMIDRFGQYMHRDWPGKTQSEADLQRRRQEEAAELTANPGPNDWTQYGGWAAGPQLDATGHFRVQKHAGKWWLVDPTGRLFWSHGIDCVRPSTAYTPITDRKFYFAELPARNTPLAQFYGRRDWAPHGYYQGKGMYVTYNFTGSNLYRKYGPEWRTQFDDLCHRRLRSWGLNTIANWSDPEIFRLRRTPYVVTVGSGRKPIEGSTGYWGKFPDPFDPAFTTTTRRNVSRSKDDIWTPWCLGVFVDNELAWGNDGTSLAAAALASPRDQAAKQAFVGDLKQRYGTVEKLNKAWETNHASWDALLDSRTPPDEAKAREDLAAFYTRIAEEYFEVCRGAVKAVAPNKLYLGCRFAWVNDRAIRAAAKHCDVIGFNKYSYSVADFSLPEGVDSPAIIGEFHFGALDRGMFHTGLRATKNQAERAEAYKSYVRGALKNRYLVGTHWFQFGDQATTGRGDGENYQIGFLDVCDTPYPEIVAASREIGAEMYQLRLVR